MAIHFKPLADERLTMSRSGYTEDCDNNWDLIMYRGQVASAIRGKRGQAFLREMAEALDALPEKRLIAYELRQGDSVCAIGCVGVKRGIEMEKIDPEDAQAVADAFGIARPLVCEIEYMNDDAGPYWSNEDTPERRWQRVRQWVAEQIKPAE